MPDAKEFSQIKTIYEHALMTKLNPELTKKEPAKKKEEEKEIKEEATIVKEEVKVEDGEKLEEKEFEEVEMVADEVSASHDAVEEETTEKMVSFHFHLNFYIFKI